MEKFMIDESELNKLADKRPFSFKNCGWNKSEVSYFNEMIAKVPSNQANEIVKLMNYAYNTGVGDTVKKIWIQCF